MTKPETVRLGFQLETGDPVDIPLRHMVVTGQTQEAGKTTTLEALIDRSMQRAIAFITKRGEGTFANANVIRPYFHERADWQFVASILEASRGEKLKFERAWIIRASKGAQTLREVQVNVRRLMAKAGRGMSADVYLTLDAYLDVVIPLVSEIEWATSLELRPGVNVVDLSAIPVEMQHLVIRSSIEWVLEREHSTIVVVPEAWKFLPQGRGTPVKLAAESFIRQAASLGNYLWLDSQDIGGVEKTILRSVPVWLLGVQREANEIKRTLANIPAGIGKPKADAIAHLGIGQFVACWGKHIVPTYVWPSWLDEETATDVAMGGTVIGRPVPKENPMAVSQREADLERENRELKDQVRELQKRLGELAESARSSAPSSNHNGASRARAEDERTGSPNGKPSADAGWTPAGDEDGLYSRLLSRLLEEPKLLRVTKSRPELEVKVTRQVIEANENTLRGRLAILISEGFFDEGATGSAAHSELQRRAIGSAKPNVYKGLDEIAALGFLTKGLRDGEGYRVVPGMKVNIVEA